MPYPHTRSDERRSNTPGRTPGVVVVTPKHGRMFFAGGSYDNTDLAMVLARRVLSEAELTDPETRIEFGFVESDGVTWSCTKKLKVPASAPTPTGSADQGWG